MLDEVQRRFPSRHFVMIDDKPQILAAMKNVLTERLRTVFVRQGHYAAESAHIQIRLAPDLIVERIGELCDFSRTAFLPSKLSATRASDQEVP